MSDTGYLALMLDAPLMSWGHASRFTRRTSALHPTRSALLGLLCAAKGVAKGSDDERVWLSELELVRMTVLTLPRQPTGCHQALAVRRLEDFHTTRGTRSAENKIKKEAVISHRQYLLDARFGVILSGAMGTLQTVETALRNPRWGVWFGRKSCIPAAPILGRNGVVATVAEAMSALGLEGRMLEQYRRVEETTFDGGTDTLMDTPVNFLTREFKPRRIHVHPG